VPPYNKTKDLPVAIAYTPDGDSYFPILQRCLMTRFTASFSILVALVAILGCGDGERAIAGGNRGVGGQTAGFAGAGAGSGAAGASGFGGTEWVYPTEDEGAFPKDRVLNILVTMPEDAWTKLIATAKQEIWSSANVTIDGQNVGAVGFRPKGEYSLDSCVDATGNLTCDKLSFKLKFNEIDPDGRFYGLKRLVLNQVLDGWSLFVEPLAYQIFNDFGIAAPRTSYAVLTVNGKSLGIYKVVESVDGRFTNHHFPDGDGNLYKEAWPVRTDDGYFNAALETNEETASHAAIKAFAADMLAASDAGLPEALAKHMELDKILDYMAVDYAIANWDGITTFYAGSWGRANHNYYLYQRGTDASTFTLIPWDLNAVFFLDHWLGDVKPWDALDVDCNTLILTEAGNISTLPATCDPTIRAIALSKERYHASVQRLLDEVFVVDRLSKKVDEYVSQVAPVMQNDPFVSYNEMTGSAVYVKTAIRTLRSRLEAVLTGGSGGASSAGTICEDLCGASTDLDCYDKGNCISDCETRLVAPLVDVCPGATLQAYAACLLGADQPTACSNGSLTPNPEVCPTESHAVKACAIAGSAGTGSASAPANGGSTGLAGSNAGGSAGVD
jgi:spore coat protein H